MHSLDISMPMFTWTLLLSEPMDYGIQKILPIMQLSHVGCVIQKATVVYLSSDKALFPTE